MNDDLVTLTDARGRDAGEALSRAAAMRSWNSSAPKRPALWLRPAMVTAVVVAVVASVVWVARRPVEPTSRLDPAQLRYVIGEVPPKWTAQQAREANDGFSDLPSDVRHSVFGTPGDATAPVLELMWQDPSRKSSVTVGGMMSLAVLDNLREITAGDGVAACGDMGSALRCVLESANGMLQSTSSGLSDSDVGRMLSVAEFAEGEPNVEPAELPVGMTLLSQGSFGDQQPVLWAPIKVPGASQVSYVGRASDDRLILNTGWADENDLAGAAIWGGMERVDVGGRTGYLGVSGFMGVKGLFWSEGLRTFALVTSDPSLDLVIIAESVRAATGAEWSAIVVEHPLGSDETTLADGTVVAVPETIVSGAPAETTPPVFVPPSTEVRDVVINQKVRPLSEFDAAYSSELPDGVFGEIRIAVVADTVLAREASARAGSFSWQLDGTVFTQASPYSSTGDGVNSVIAASTDPVATQLRVTRRNGDRYLLDLVAVQKNPGLRVGVVMLPPGSFVTFDVVDADGNILVTYGDS